jgi:hypothetical protein
LKTPSGQQRQRHATVFEQRGLLAATTADEAKLFQGDATGEQLLGDGLHWKDVTTRAPAGDDDGARH